MASCFSGSLLRANFSIGSLFFLFDGVIVRGKYIFLPSFFLSFCVFGSEARGTEYDGIR